jgi:hypothetical protein
MPEVLSALPEFVVCRSEADQPMAARVRRCAMSATAAADGLAAELRPRTLGRGPEGVLWPTAQR